MSALFTSSAFPYIILFFSLKTIIPTSSFFRKNRTFPISYCKLPLPLGFVTVLLQNNGDPRESAAKRKTTITVEP